MRLAAYGSGQAHLAQLLCFLSSFFGLRSPELPFSIAVCFQSGQIWQNYLGKTEQFSNFPYVFEKAEEYLVIARVYTCNYAERYHCLNHIALRRGAFLSAIGLNGLCVKNS